MRYTYHYLQYTVNWCTPMMLFCIKLQSFAWNYHDGQKPPARPFPEGNRIEKLPSPLEYFSWLFFFAGFLTGPVGEFQDYISFTNRSMFKDEVSLPSFSLSLPLSFSFSFFPIPYSFPFSFPCYSSFPFSLLFTFLPYSCSPSSPLFSSRYSSLCLPFPFPPFPPLPSYLSLHLLLDFVLKISPYFPHLPSSSSTFPFWSASIKENSSFPILLLIILWENLTKSNLWFNGSHFECIAKRTNSKLIHSCFQEVLVDVCWYFRILWSEIDSRILLRIP